MGLSRIFGALAQFWRDERGGESVECALATVSIAGVSLGTQRALAAGINDMVATATDHIVSACDQSLR